MSPVAVADGCPLPLQRMLENAYGMGYEEKPDYHFLRSLLDMCLRPPDEEGSGPPVGSSGLTSTCPNLTSRLGSFGASPAGTGSHRRCTTGADSELSCTSRGGKQLRQPEGAIHPTRSDFESEEPAGKVKRPPSDLEPLKEHWQHRASPSPPTVRPPRPPLNKRRRRIDLPPPETDSDDNQPDRLSQSEVTVGIARAAGSRARALPPGSLSPPVTDCDSDAMEATGLTRMMVRLDSSCQ